MTQVNYIARLLNETKRWGGVLPTEIDKVIESFKNGLRESNPNFSDEKFVRLCNKPDAWE